MTQPRILPSLSALPGLLDSLGSHRILVACGPSRRGLDELVGVLGEHPVAIFDGARRHVPRAVVDEALRRAREHDADTVVSLGGGSATGLGKLLKRELGSSFVAVPTTYAGSEFTNLYGVTDQGDKVTGRDDAVLPDGVVQDVAFTLAMPLAMTGSSLLNALAHPLSVLGAADSDSALDASALEAAAETLRSLEHLLRYPRDETARKSALVGAAACARALMAGKPGLQHRLAHRLGGRFDVDHSSLHAVLLPHTVRQLRLERGDRHARIATALGVADLEGELYDLLQRSGAPTSSSALGISREGLEALLREEPDLPAELLWAAHHGRRPSRSVARLDWGLREPVARWGPELAEARRVVVALHGRGSNADAMLRRTLEMTGNDPDVGIVALQAPDGSWYSRRHVEPRQSLGAELETSLAEVMAALDRVAETAPRTPVVLLGFSQGACLAFEVLARRDQPLAALVALSGSGIGGRGEAPDFRRGIAGTPVLMGASQGDPWLNADEVALTAEQLSEVGCEVTLAMVPGDAHAFHERQRWLARPLLRGLPAPATRGGFRAVVETEGLPGALPVHQNSPRKPPYGLYAEQVNATGFVAERAHNLRSWFYRIRPSAQHSPFEPLPHPTFGGPLDERPEINLAGYAPLPIPEAPTDFVDGLVSVGGAGSPQLRRGFAVHLYAANRHMQDRCFCNADGELLLLPELGALTLLTECGVLELAPGSLAVIPRGLRFSVLLDQPRARGYVAEAYGRPFELPDRGPMGANGLSETRNFRAPGAWHEDRLAVGYRVTHKLGGALHEAKQDYSPYDVVAWHGNLAPYVYDLSHFSPITNARFDHPDPSSLTVLSAPLDERGSHALDLVAFVPRWDPTEDTFKPPYFHRNATTELNGIIKAGGSQDPRFAAGSLFLTPNLTPHAVSSRAVERFNALGDDEANRPSRTPDDSLWFQFESALPFCLTAWAKQAPSRNVDWPGIWGTHRSYFAG